MKKETINKKDVLAKIKPIIENVSASLGLIPIEIDFSKEAGRWHLRIFIYSEDHPISHQDCEKLTKNLDEYLDQVIPIPYYLEVSSPGTDRKLKSPREHDIFRGKKVEVKLRQPVDDKPKNFTAKLIGYSPEKGLKVQLLDKGEELYISDNNIFSIRLKAEYKI